MRYFTKHLKLYLGLGLLLLLNSSVFSQNYFPLVDGSFWTNLINSSSQSDFSSSETTYVSKSKLDGTQSIAGQAWQRMIISNEFDSITDTTYVRIEGSKVYVLSDNDTSGSGLRGLTATQIFDFERNPGETYMISQLDSAFYDSDLGQVTASLLITAQILPGSTVVASGQTFPNCYGIRTYVSFSLYDSTTTLILDGKDTVNSYFAPNMGQVLTTSSATSVINFFFSLTVFTTMKTELIEYVEGGTSIKKALLSQNETSSFSIYPNPAKEKIKITMNNKSDHINNVSLYDVQGRLILNVYHGAINKTHQVKLDLNLNGQKLPPGWYLLKLVSVGKEGMKIQNQKFSVIR